MDPLIAMIGGYSLCLLAIAWAVDVLGMRSAHKSAQWRTGNFLYHEDQDAWQCHEDQWLWPASFDPEKRVIRYEGQHAICGRCPAKDECSPTPGPREITRQLDPWPHSEAGRFHRGISLVIAIIATFLPVFMLLIGGAGTVAEYVVLIAMVLVCGIAAFVFGRHLWNTPTNFPQHLKAEGYLESPDKQGEEEPLEALVDRYATRWGGDRSRVPDSQKG
ncbi:MAG TPA: hypothetical protein PKX56_06140 [Marmoricola sp.]|nr:hypothetical protein [Marmoricola sp.]HNJ78915.1 hypothetical protein [Marmoricola sp.]HNN48361.1 hypothetical protein [Marmoricola sp.]HNO39432.1 hypothetical protein [Marmoricola sp.]